MRSVPSNLEATAQTTLSHIKLHEKSAVPVLTNTLVVLDDHARTTRRQELNTVWVCYY